MTKKNSDYNDMLYEIVQGFPTTQIAIDFDKSSSYISQIKKKVQQLKYQPEIIAGDLVCTKCKCRPENVLFEIHHNHETGQQIGIVCHSCNIKIGRNGDLDYMSENPKPHNLECKVMRVTKDMAKYGLIDVEIQAIIVKLPTFFKFVTFKGKGGHKIFFEENPIFYEAVKKAGLFK